MLLNDTDNRLYNDILEYSILRNLDEQIKNKYQRHYEDDLRQNQDRISIDFTNLKKERLHLPSSRVTVNEPEAATISWLKSR